MFIEINDKYKVQFKEGCWTPFKFEEGGKELSGRYKGNISKPKWVNSNKYFMKLEHALKHIVEDTLCENTQLTLKEFLDGYKSQLDELKRITGGM